MHSFLPTIILRHRKENLKKCSLKGLEKRNDLVFYTYPITFPKDLNGYMMLHMLGEELTEKDQDKGLFLLDSTWRYEEKMRRYANQKAPLQLRKIPDIYRTAYPRAQTGCIDEKRGLATVEALYIALKILNRPTEGLLENYYWKDSFLKINEEAFALLDKSR